MASAAAGLAAVVMKRVSRFLLNKKLLSGLLEEELDEEQCELSVRDEENIVTYTLHNIRLRPQTLSAGLPEGLGVEFESATVRKLIIKIPAPSISSTWSGHIGVQVNPVGIVVEGLDFVLEPSTGAEAHPSPADGLTASLMVLRAAFDHMDDEDLPDDDDSDAPSARPGEIGDGADGAASGESSRATLVRWLEKVLGATKLTVSDVKLRYRHLAEDLDYDDEYYDWESTPAQSPGKVSGQGSASELKGELVVSSNQIVVTNLGVTDPAEKGSKSDSEPGQFISKRIAFDYIKVVWIGAQRGTARSGQDEFGSEAGQSEETILMIDSGDAQANEIDVCYDERQGAKMEMNVRLTEILGSITPETSRSLFNVWHDLQRSCLLRSHSDLRDGDVSQEVWDGNSRRSVAVSEDSDAGLVFQKVALNVQQISLVLDSVKGVESVKAQFNGLMLRQMGAPELRPSSAVALWVEDACIYQCGRREEGELAESTQQVPICYFSPWPHGRAKEDWENLVLARKAISSSVDEEERNRSLRELSQRSWQTHACMIFHGYDSVLQEFVDLDVDAVSSELAKAERSRIAITFQVPGGGVKEPSVSLNCAPLTLQLGVQQAHRIQAAIASCQPPNRDSDEAAVSSATTGMSSTIYCRCLVQSVTVKAGLEDGLDQETLMLGLHLLSGEMSLHPDQSYFQARLSSSTLDLLGLGSQNARLINVLGPITCTGRHRHGSRVGLNAIQEDSNTSEEGDPDDLAARLNVSPDVETLLSLAISDLRGELAEVDLRRLDEFLNRQVVLETETKNMEQSLFESALDLPAQETSLFASAMTTFHSALGKSSAISDDSNFFSSASVNPGSQGGSDDIFGMNSRAEGSVLGRLTSLKVEVLVDTVGVALGPCSTSCKAVSVKGSTILGYQKGQEGPATVSLYFQDLEAGYSGDRCVAPIAGRTNSILVKLDTWSHELGAQIEGVAVSPKIREFSSSISEQAAVLSSHGARPVAGGRNGQQDSANPPSGEIWNLQLVLQEDCVTLSVPGCQSEGVLAVAKAEVSVQSDTTAAVKLSVETNVEWASLFAIDDIKELKGCPFGSCQDFGSESFDSQLYRWGYVRIGTCQNLHTILQQQQDNIILQVPAGDFEIGVCTDALQTVSNLVVDSAKLSVEPSAKAAQVSERLTDHHGHNGIQDMARQRAGSQQGVKSAKGRSWKQAAREPAGGLSTLQESWSSDWISVADGSDDAGGDECLSGSVSCLLDQPPEIFPQHFDIQRLRLDRRRKRAEAKEAANFLATISGVNLKMTIFSGKDWCQAPRGPVRSVRPSSGRRRDQPSHGVSVIDVEDDVISVSTGKSEELYGTAYGGGGRDYCKSIEFVLLDICAKHFVCTSHDGADGFNSRLSVRDIEIIDGVSSSKFDKILNLLDDGLPRDKGPRGHMIRCAMSGGQVEEKEKLTVAILPIQFNLDQDTARFLLEVFGSVDEAVEGNGVAEDEAVILTEAEDAASGSVFVSIRPTKIKLNFSYKGLDTSKFREGDIEQRIALLMFLYGDALPPLSFPRTSFLVVEELNADKVFAQYLQGCQGSLTEQLTKASASSLPLMRNALQVGEGLAGLVLEPYRDRHKLRGVHRGGTKAARAVIENSLDLGAVFLSSVTTALERAESALAGKEAGEISQTGGLPMDATPHISLRQALKTSATEAIQGLKAAYQYVAEDSALRKRHGGAKRPSFRRITLAVVAPTRGFLGALQKTVVGARNAMGSSPKP